jgi:hypothetical protein
MEGDQKVVESASKRPRQIFSLDGIQQLFLVNVGAESMCGTKVGLVAEGGIQSEGMIVEAVEKVRQSQSLRSHINTSHPRDALVAIPTSATYPSQ